MFKRHNKVREQMQNEDDEQCEDFAQNPAALLANGIEMIIENMAEQVFGQLAAKLDAMETNFSQVAAKQDQTLDQIVVNLAGLSAQLGKIQTGQQQIIYSLEHIDSQLERLITITKLLENASKENHLLSKEHYQDYIVQPIARSLFPVFDFVENAKIDSCEYTQENKASLQELIEGILIQLRQFLSVYEIEVIQHKPGAVFDPRVMRPVKVIPIDSEELDNCIATSLQAGFCWRHERLLRSESVILCRYGKNVTNNYHKNERSEK